MVHSAGGHCSGAGIRYPSATFSWDSVFVMPGYGVLPLLAASHKRMPKDQTSVLAVNVKSWSTTRVFCRNTRGKGVHGHERTGATTRRHHQRQGQARQENVVRWLPPRINQQCQKRRSFNVSCQARRPAWCCAHQCRQARPQHSNDGAWSLSRRHQTKTHTSTPVPEEDDVHDTRLVPPKLQAQSISAASEHLGPHSGPAPQVRARGQGLSKETMCRGDAADSGRPHDSRAVNEVATKRRRPSLTWFGMNLASPKSATFASCVVPLMRRRTFRAARSVESSSMCTAAPRHSCSDDVDQQSKRDFERSANRGSRLDRPSSSRLPVQTPCGR